MVMRCEARCLTVSQFVLDSSVLLPQHRLWSAMLWLTVSKQALASNEQSDHSVSVPVNRGGLHIRRASTFISPRVDPAAWPTSSSITLRNQLSALTSGTPGWVHRVASTKLSRNESRTMTVCHDELRPNAPAHSHDLRNDHA